MKNTRRTKNSIAAKAKATTSARPLTASELQAGHEYYGYHKGDWARRWLPKLEMHEECGGLMDVELLKRRKADLRRRGFEKQGWEYRKVHSEILLECHRIPPPNFYYNGIKIYTTSNNLWLDSRKGFFLEEGLVHQRSLRIWNWGRLSQLTKRFQEAIRKSLAENKNSEASGRRLPFRVEHIANKELSALVDLHWPLIRALQLFDPLSPDFPAFSLQPLHGVKNPQPYLNFLNVLSQVYGLSQRRGAPKEIITSQTKLGKARTLREGGLSFPKIVERLHPVRAHSEERDKLIKRYQRALKDTPVSRPRALR